jgi:uncharacterized protein YndB with AHSA1/START domain
MAVKQGYFLIADITGYTQYLSETELDHAQNILTSLLNLLIEHTRPPLIISRLAGDAVISYGLSDHFLVGQTFAESLEDTYVSFRRMVELMVRNTTCPCNACRNIGSLDLKFFVHYGEFAVKKLDAHDELVGSDVNLLHRLLKNHVTEALGLKAYTLYSDAAIHKLGLENLSGLIRHEESYEHLGAVTVWIEDMHPVWDKKRHESQAAITPARELIRASVDIALMPELVWDYLIRPEHFRVLLAATKVEVVKRAGDKVMTGSMFQCYHGEGVQPMTIIEWQPFERIVAEFVAIKGILGHCEFRLEPIEGGTRFTQLMAKGEGPIGLRHMYDWQFKKMMGKFDEDMQRFKAHIEADWAQFAAPPQASVPEAIVRTAARESLTAA